MIAPQVAIPSYQQQNTDGFILAFESFRVLQTQNHQPIIARRVSIRLCVACVAIQHAKLPTEP